MIIDFFDRGWSMDPEAPAYVSETESVTYEQAGRLTCRVANALLDRGVGRETSIGVLAGNDITAWLCIMGAWRAGGAWVPLNPSYPDDAVVEQIADFDCEVLFTTREAAERLAGRLESVPRLKEVVVIDAPELDAWLGDSSDERPSVSQSMDDIVMVAPTGGTTGKPKGVMITHRNLAVTCAHFMQALHYPADQPIHYLAAAPMTHTAGFISLPTVARGGTVHLIPRAEPRAILAAIERWSITEFFLPPTVIYRLLDVPEAATTDFSSLRYLCYGAAPMSVDKLRRAIGTFGPVMVEGYGQMEAPAAISFLRPEEHLVDGEPAADERLRSCGRPYPLVRVSIRDADLKEVARGETGEILVGGDLVMKGYYKDPEQTAAVLQDGWLRTGDLGSLDDAGYLTITGRAKDMIITGGFNVYPGEIEQVIASHPAVEDCAVVGVPHDDWGEEVVAAVQCYPGSTVTADELSRLCRGRVGSIYSPKHFVFVDALPRSANGKVVKTRVRDDLVADSQIGASHAAR